MHNFGGKKIPVDSYQQNSIPFSLAFLHLSHSIAVSLNSLNPTYEVIRMNIERYCLYVVLHRQKGSLV